VPVQPAFNKEHREVPRPESRRPAPKKRRCRVLDAGSKDRQTVIFLHSRGGSMIRKAREVVQLAGNR